MEKSQAFLILKHCSSRWQDGEDPSAWLKANVEDVIVPAFRPQIQFLSDGPFERWAVTVGTRGFSMSFWDPEVLKTSLLSLKDVLDDTASERGRAWTQSPEGRDFVGKTWSLQIMNREFEHHGPVKCGGVREFGRMVSSQCPGGHVCAKRGEYSASSSRARSGADPLVTALPQVTSAPMRVTTSNPHRPRLSSTTLDVSSWHTIPTIPAQKPSPSS